MKVVAFDIGTNMAVAWRADYGALQTASFPLLGANRAEKLSYCWQQLRLWRFCSIGGLVVDAVFFERPFARGQAATRMLWGIAGVLEAFAATMGLPVVDRDPATIKKFVTGKGTATKDEMIVAARLLGYTGLNEHEADAVCGLIYAEVHVEKDIS